MQLVHRPKCFFERYEVYRELVAVLLAGRLVPPVAPAADLLDALARSKRFLLSYYHGLAGSWRSRKIVAALLKEGTWEANGARPSPGAAALRDAA
jgi:hypothetical protein